MNRAVPIAVDSQGSAMLEVNDLLGFDLNHLSGRVNITNSV